MKRLYMKQERWKDAERLQSRVLEELRKTDVIDMRKFNFYRKRRGMSSLKLGRLDIAVEDFRALLDEADAPQEDFEELLVLLFHVAMVYSARATLPATPPVGQRSNSNPNWSAFEFQPQLVTVRISTPTDRLN